MGKQAKQWIVQGAAVSSGALSKYIETQSDIEELGHIAPDIVMVAATDSMAERLKNEFPDLVMAPDEYLEAFIE